MNLGMASQLGGEVCYETGAPPPKVEFDVEKAAVLFKLVKKGVVGPLEEYLNSEGGDQLVNIFHV